MKALSAPQTHFTAKLAGLAAAVAIALATVGAGEAKAYGQIGPYQGASVVCDPLYNSISLMPHFGASPLFNGQWLAYNFWIRNVVTGQSAWAFPSPKTVWHQRVLVQGAITEISNYLITGNTLVPRPNGFYEVWTRYFWYDGGWFSRDVRSDGYQIAGVLHQINGRTVCEV